MKQFRRLLAYLKPYWPAAVAAPLFMTLEVAMDLSLPRLMQQIVDIGLARSDMAYVMQTGLRMLMLTLFGVAGGVLCAYFSAVASVSMGTDIRQALYSRIQKLSFRGLDRLDTGGLITRLTSDIIQVEEVTMMMMRIVVRAPLLVAGSLVMAVIISPKLSLILLVLIPLLVMATLLTVRKALPLFSRVQSRLDRVNTVTQENLAGVRVVKAFVQEESEKERFAEANDSLMQTMMQASRVMVMIMPVVMLILNGGIAAVLYFGGILTIEGLMTAGKLMAFIYYLMQMLMSLMMIAMVMVRFSRSLASAARIMEVFDAPAGLPSAADPIKDLPFSGAVSFENVTFHYGNPEVDKAALHELSLDIPAGKLTAIMGTTGSGKTTLINLIPRMYDVTSGRITYDGIDIRETDELTLRSRIRVVPQQAVLFSGTVRENIAWALPGASDADILRAAETAQALEFIEKLPEGLDTSVNQRGVNLSGGQKQRLAIARAILGGPPLLILDDSTSALDMTTAARLVAALKKERRGQTTLLIAQRIDSVKNADRIHVLSDGRLAGSGSHASLLADCPLYREIYESQTGEENAHAG